MSSRRMNSRDSERVQNRNGNVGMERIRSGDVSEALTEVFREEIRLPRAPDCGDSVAHLFRHFKLAGNLEKRLQDVPRSDDLYEIKKVVQELKFSLKMAQDRERTNDAQLIAAEKLGNQAASHDDERKLALEQVSFLEAHIKSSASKYTDDLRRATYDA
ncbi:hypothetical protein F2Q69_00006196 [Brassica cretica]|uniref:Uncharacterized protein n=1 Tax=Brassica cretica TaxID=69181 RepID=A0A8S9NWU8_BRACR|nr:hypothetical protein F2Q69_00006196 [Brassica cretica]